jgi:Folylpolyglutamate synthase
MPLTFEQALEFVSGLQHRGWRLGLDRMREFVVRAGLLNSIEGDLAPRFIHVAGTNGKGSTTAYVQSVLMSQGFRVGGYFSPYVYHVTERIQLGGEPISDDEFARLVEALIPVATSMDESELGPVTEFEFKTAMGLRCWGDGRVRLGGP